MRLRRDIAVIRGQRTQSRASKADDTALFFGDDDELIVRRRREAFLPNTDPVLHDVAVEELIAIRTAIGDAPVLGVESGDCKRMLVRRFSVTHQERLPSITNGARIQNTDRRLEKAQ